MKKFLIIIPLILLAGCEFKYRYECQDPQNWGKEMCNNDVCKAEGDCATDLLGFTPTVAEQFKKTNGEPEAPGFARKFSKPADQSISNSGDCKPSEKPKFKPFNSTVQQNTFKNSQQNNSNPMDPIKRPKAEEMVGQIEEVERPLTMNTIIKTSGHNSTTKINKW
jgi:hypothetical protein